MSLVSPASLPPMAVDRPWLLAVAVCAVLAWLTGARLASRRRASRLHRFADPVAWARLGVSSAPGRAAALRVAAVLLLGGVALAGPRWGVARAGAEASGIDMALVLDASLSMLAPDERPSRLERLKQEVRRLRAMAPADRVALIAFAGRSYVLAPLTTDEGALQLYLDTLDPSMVGEGGSSLARALRQGTELLLASDGVADRALVVLGDGETFEPIADVEAAAREAGRRGVHVVTVGFGTPGGATIPVREEGGRLALKRDPEGRVVTTRYVAATLEAAARAADGEFIPAEAGDKAARIRRAVRDLRTARRAQGARDELVLRVHWFLLPALALLLWDSWRQPVSPRARRRSRGRAPAVAAAALLLPGCARAPDPAALYEAGDVRGALASYRRAHAEGDSTVRTRFNLGTAYLANDSVAAALELLEGARREADGELRMRARYNAAVGALRRAREPGAPEAERWLAIAREALRALLRERPGDLDAKWNYELALRSDPGGGGGGGGAGQGEGQAPEPEQGDAQPPASGALDTRQAEALLNSAAREERDVHGRRQPRGRAPTGGKDW